MKKIVLLLTLLVFSTILFGQETFDPKVTRKSSKDTYINKIVLVDNYTVVSMKYVSKSLQEQLDEYISSKPELKSQLERLDSYTRKMYMERMARQLQQGSSTISFQSTSYLKSKDGRRFKFIKASSIPVSPDNIAAEPDKRYYFKVYFERLPPGIEEIDLIEGENQRADQPVTYWNFYGVQVNNPANPAEAEKSVEKPAIAEAPAAILPVEKNLQITLSGRVLDSQTDEPVAAKIVCVTKKSGVKYDSVVTSKSGLYEFVIPPDDYLYKITAPGYKLSEEAYNLANLKANGSFSRNFYLEPETTQTQATTLPTPVESTEIPTSDPVQVNENTFRLDKVYFNTGEAVITPESFTQLDGLASMMQQDPNMKIQVVGHTDNQGDSRLNKKLSLQRAFNVREYLISQGIDGKRIKFNGVGGESPIAPNDTEENRQKNRRVEFIILDK